MRMLTDEKKAVALEFAATMYSINPNIKSVIYEVSYFLGDSEEEKEELAQYLRKFYSAK